MKILVIISLLGCVFSSVKTSSSPSDYDEIGAPGSIDNYFQNSSFKAELDEILYNAVAKISRSSNSSDLSICSSNYEKAILKYVQTSQTECESCLQDTQDATAQLKENRRKEKNSMDSKVDNLKAKMDACVEADILETPGCHNKNGKIYRRELCSLMMQVKVEALQIRAARMKIARKENVCVEDSTRKLKGNINEEYKEYKDCIRAERGKA